MSAFVPGPHPLWLAFAYGVCAGTLGWGLTFVGIYWREYVEEWKSMLAGLRPEPSYRGRHGGGRRQQQKPQRQQRRQDPTPHVQAMHGGMTLVREIKEPDARDRTIEHPVLIDGYWRAG